MFVYFLTIRKNVSLLLFCRRIKLMFARSNSNITEIQKEKRAVNDNPFILFLFCVIGNSGFTDDVNLNLSGIFKFGFDLL